MSSYYLAQINLARAKYDLDDPRMKGFVDAIGEINSLAEAQVGFIWRLIDAADPTSYLQAASDPRLLINMSVWSDLEPLKRFVYKSAHGKMVGQRKQWFEPMSTASQALWWIPKEHRPSIEEGMERLEKLQAQGPGPDTFTFRSACPAPDAQHRSDPDPIVL